MRGNSKLIRCNPFVLKEWHLILLFAAIKLAIHLLAFSNFELNRDAYLYYAQSEHLAWGYFSASPVTALIGRIATLIFGNTVFALRFLPALTGALFIRLFYGKAIGIPQPISFNGSVPYWSPDSLSKDYMIWVYSDLGSEINPDTLLPKFFKKVEVKVTINNKYFRKNGTRIYLCESPAEDCKNFFINGAKYLKNKYIRK